MLEKLRKKAQDLNDQEIIDILSDDMCFFKLNIDETLYILKKLNIKEDKLMSVILSLINKEEYLGEDI